MKNFQYTEFIHFIWSFRSFLSGLTYLIATWLQSTAGTRLKRSKENHVNSNPTNSNPKVVLIPAGVWNWKSSRWSYGYIGFGQTFASFFIPGSALSRFQYRRRRGTPRCIEFSSWSWIRLGIWDWPQFAIELRNAIVIGIIDFSHARRCPRYPY